MSDAADPPPATEQVPAIEQQDEAALPAEPPKDLDTAMSVTPAQAMELNRRAQEIKHGYALLAMKRIENAFAGLDDENNMDQGTEVVDLGDEEKKLNEAMAAYASELQSYGFQPGTNDFETAMADLTQPMDVPKETVQEPTVPVMPPKAVDPLPYHNVWKSGVMELGKDEINVEEKAEEELVPEPPVEVEPTPIPVPPEEEKIDEVPVKEPEPVSLPPPVQPPVTVSTSKPHTQKRLPPILPRPTLKKPTPVVKQSVQARPLTLSFTNFSAAFPTDHSNQPTHHPPPSQHHYHQPSQISLLPPDATPLRVLAPQRMQTSYPGITSPFIAGPVRPMQAGGGMVQAGMQQNKKANPKWAKQAQEQPPPLTIMEAVHGPLPPIKHASQRVLQMSSDSRKGPRG
ncbi:uncharacterized protein SPPG_01193 [Spizellomyces punctatus DAOM BR117]|uniref:Uncharacterized protein n=1 Tax=Spizellomyces punctatus (strain DAOM BR117) TaxID=645134 RepID=A0A0L0HS55_SPIPD|nr:uncharacterized protein SPPG_01193 [Spizellomyces punctatus DAOM BR117]KND03735.1 hypothetical protein SPPG_01193 [Spizellomyces punctatus DAOM BR117]|eukprot:XP_016611774.1 hypothetical protein SPPG_01193 [Spizellomyces punctatus DAOM BR117]